jgi:hypothetical protein
MAFNGNRVLAGPGTLYVAPLGTTEPTTITGAWPGGWVLLGYTDKGNDFDWAPQFQPIEVEEELFPVRNVPNGYKGTLSFTLAEWTGQNLGVAINAGIGSGLDASAQGTNPDGSIWYEPPTPGAEVRVMIGWDALPKGAVTETSTSVGGSTVYQGFGRWIYRQCINTTGVKISHQKGANKAMFAVSFELELPTVGAQSGLPPFRAIFPASLAA